MSARLPAPFAAGVALIVTLLASAGASAATHAARPPGVDLTGEWVLDAAASDPSPLPPARPRAAGSPAQAVLHTIPPEDSVLPDPVMETDPATGRPLPIRRRPPSWLFRPERLEAFRVLLGETPSLSIVQTATYLDLRTVSSARSLELGGESQVSLPTGELADQRVRWQGRRLVVERRVPRGPKLVETYQLLPETGQLEVVVRRSGGDGLGKLEWRRLFGRDTGDPALAREAAP